MRVNAEFITAQQELTLRYLAETHGVGLPLPAADPKGHTLCLRTPCHFLNRTRASNGPHRRVWVGPFHFLSTHLAEVLKRSKN